MRPTLIISNQDILMNYFACRFTTLSIMLRFKKYLLTEFRSSRKLILFTMGPYGAVKKRAKFLRFFHICFYISALGITFSFKYRKTIVKSHQMVKF